MKRFLSLILSLCILLSCAVFFTGCSTGGVNSKDWPVTIGDVTIEKEPENIVVLNDVCADIISYIGYDIKMSGRSDECDQDFLYIVPTVGPAANPDITGTDADLVIADKTLSADAKSKIEATGAKVVIFDVPTTPEQLKNLYSDLGTVLGGKETGKEKGESGYEELLEMLSTMNTATSNVVQPVAYLYLDDSKQLCTFMKGTLEYQFFNYNGNDNVFANQENPVVNVEELRIGSPNFIFYDNETVLNTLTADADLANVTALIKQQTLLIPKKSFFRFGKSAEQAVFDMLNYIEKTTKATPDEATPDAAAAAAEAPAAKAPAAPTATEAPAANDVAADDGEVINFSIEE